MGFITDAAILDKMRETQKAIATIPQKPGCLPEGYDENSYLTLAQFAKWKQQSLGTVRRRATIIPGLVRHSRQDIRVHVKTHLNKVLKRQS